MYSTLRPCSLKTISEATSRLFRHPILVKINGATRAIFDFFKLVKLRALSLVSEEIIYSDYVSPCPERVDYILKMAGVYLFDRFSDSLKLKSSLSLSFARLVK